MCTPTTKWMDDRWRALRQYALDHGGSFTVALDAYTSLTPSSTPENIVAIRTIKVTPAEFDIILAGIRLLASETRNNQIAPDSMIGEIINNCGEHPMPTYEEIEALGDRINTGA